MIWAPGGTPGGPGGGAGGAGELFDCDDWLFEPDGCDGPEDGEDDPPAGSAGWLIGVCDCGVDDEGAAPPQPVNIKPTGRANIASQMWC